MSDALRALGTRRMTETVNEAVVPMAASAGAWLAARYALSGPAVGAPLAPFERFVVLGAVAVLVAWYTGRQLALADVRRPWLCALWSVGAVAVAIWSLSVFVGWGFESGCTALGGTVLETRPLLSTAHTVCRIGGVPDNPYLPGTLLRPTWDGTLGVPAALGLGVVGLLAGLGLRNVRLWPTRMGLTVVDELRMAPAAGPAAVAGGGDEVQGCGNPTLWGEPCGQLYDARRVFEPGEWCLRCAQVYRRAERTVTFRVVTLFTADVDVLNGLERLDALAWPQGDPQPPDARLSGQERWVRVGQIEVPDVVTVATLLGLVHARLKGWMGRAPEHAQPAFELAMARMSRLSAWIWFGQHDNRLTYARPTDRAVLAVGPTRLRDLALEVGEELVLQLDIGLLPLDLRTGFRRTFLAADRDAEVQNSRQDLWIPVVGPVPPADGLWVPRIEGAALRAWLSLDRLHDDSVRGVTSPRPYVASGPPATGRVRPGSLDLVRAPIVANEPGAERVPGDSIAEWAWMEQRQIELLRQQALVMTEA